MNLADYDKILYVLSGIYLPQGGIEVYKIINQKYDCAVAPELIFNPNSVTRGNKCAQSNL